MKLLTLVGIVAIVAFVLRNRGTLDAIGDSSFESSLAAGVPSAYTWRAMGPERGAH